MMNEEIQARILHVEVNPHDAELIAELLLKGGLRCHFERVFNRHSFTQAVQNESYDLILCDFSLPGFNGLDALRIAREFVPHTPFVFVSAMIGEELAVESLKQGAADYVLKDRLGRLPNAIRRALEDSRERQERRRVQQRLEEQALLLEQAADAILVCGADLRVLYANREARGFFGGGNDLAGSDLHLLLRHSTPSPEFIWESLLESGAWAGTVKRVCQDEEKILQSRWTLLRNPDGEPARILISETDVTEQRMLEAGLMRAQRMESIGALAAGVAHDVNNSLTPIVMGLDLLSATTVDADALRLLEIMRHSASQCAHLVSQVVTFARGEARTHTMIPIGALLNELIKALRQVLPRSIQIQQDIPRNLGSVPGDPTKLHQVVMNLCLNARDAMPAGGVLSLRAEQLDGGGDDEAPGRVCITISDTGVGILPEHQPKIFEPFFTTKEATGGTGLGLAIVKKIIDEHEGTISCESSPGRGTVFTLSLPASGAAHVQLANYSPRGVPSASGEVILIVEDEISLAQMMSRVLTDAGYEVITATDGASGLSAFFHRQYDIDLIITDHSMPYLDGARMLLLIRAVRPDIASVICTGLEALDTLAPAEMLLHKPFTPDRLLRAADAALHPQPLGPAALAVV